MPQSNALLRDYCCCFRQTHELVRQLIFTLNWKNGICLLIKSPTLVKQTTQNQDNFWQENAAAQRWKGRAGTQTNWQIQDEQDQTANSEQVSHCGLGKKGQFILVSHWPFKLDLECCWWAEVYQCPCPVGYELIPCWYSWCCEQICELTPPRDTIRPSLIRNRALL